MRKVRRQGQIQSVCEVLCQSSEGEAEALVGRCARRPSTLPTTAQQRVVLTAVVVGTNLLPAVYLLPLKQYVVPVCAASGTPLDDGR